MALSNLGELKASIADWINREDLTSVIPDFIKIGVDRINADVRSRIGVNEVVEVISLASENAQNPVTTTAEEVLDVFVNGEYVPSVTWAEYQRELKDSTYPFGCWTWRENELHISSLTDENDPAPAAGGDAVEIKILGLDAAADFVYGDDTSTTPLFLKSPAAFLYAALVETSIYLRDAEGVQFYQVRYEELLDKLQREYKRSKVSGLDKVKSVGGDFNFSRNY